MFEGLENNRIYPDFVPERCRSCPVMGAFVEEWQQCNTISDLVLDGLVKHSPETLGEQLPSEIVTTIGILRDQSLDPVLSEDRTEAAHIILNATDEGYHIAMERMEAVEEEMREKLSICEGRGPLKVRVRPKTGSVLVRLCQGDLGDAHYNHTHETLATVEREKEQT